MIREVRYLSLKYYRCTVLCLWEQYHIVQTSIYYTSPSLKLKSVWRLPNPCWIASDGRAVLRHGHSHLLCWNTYHVWPFQGCEGGLFWWTFWLFCHDFCPCFHRLIRVCSMHVAHCFRKHFWNNPWSDLTLHWVKMPLTVRGSLVC